MNAVRRKLQAATWLALWAMLALALLPTVSHALAWAQGSQRNWAEICTPQGTKVVALDAVSADSGDEGAPLPPATHFEYCAYCALGAAALAPPAALAAAAPLAAGAAPPRHFLHAPRTPFAWVTAQPRGPPFNA